MTSPVILTAPDGVLLDLKALRAEFNCHAVVYNWHPLRDNTAPGVLHLTCMHPDDLRAAGCTSFITRGWPGQVGATHRRTRQAQAGRISVALALDFLFACLLLGFFFGLVQALDGPSDHQAALDTASTLEDAPRSAAEQLRRDRVLERMALQAQYGGENAVPEPRPDGSIQWRTKRGHKTVTTPPAAVASSN